MKNRSKRLFTIIIPIIHIICSLVIEALTWKDYGQFHNEMTTLSDVGISVLQERAMLFIGCKVFGAVLIFGFWGLIYKMIKDKDRLSFFIMLASLIFTILLFPINIISDADCIKVYYNTVSYYPFYWHSVYVQYIYGACLMFLKHPISISFFQIISLSLCIRYVVDNLKKFGAGKKAYIPILILLLPEGYYFLGIPYRNNFYGLFMIILLSLIYVDIYIKKSIPSGRRMVVYILGIAFMTVLRGEAIVNVLVFCAFSYICLKEKADLRNKLVSFAKMAILYVLAILIISAPQKIGERKYFGRDYELINQANMLQMIISDENADLSYEDATKDIETINTYYPIEYLKKAGINGFCYINFERSGFSYQSLIDKEDQKRLATAINNLEMHNLDIMLFSRMHWFVGTNHGPVGTLYINDDGGDELTFDALAEDSEGEYYYGLSVLFDSPWTEALAYSTVIGEARTIVLRVIGVYNDFCINTYIIWILHIISFITLLSMGLLIASKKDLRKNVVLQLISLAIIGQWCALFAATPTMLYAYYYAPFYISFIWDYYLILFCLKFQKEEDK